jgi:hypothetical protein
MYDGVKEMIKRELEL